MLSLAARLPRAITAHTVLLLSCHRLAQQSAEKPDNRIGAPRKLLQQHQGLQPLLVASSPGGAGVCRWSEFSRGQAASRDNADAKCQRAEALLLLPGMQ